MVVSQKRGTQCRPQILQSLLYGPWKRYGLISGNPNIETPNWYSASKRLRLPDRSLLKLRTVGSSNQYVRRVTGVQDLVLRFPTK